MERPSRFARIGVSAITLIISCSCYGQSKRNTVQFADLTLGLGSPSNTNVSFAVGKNWIFGSKQKLQLGFGTRITGFFGNDQYFVTAPAKLVKGTSGPAALFKPTIPANMDSLFLQKHQVISVNVMLNISYAFSDRLMAGFNIDAIGLSFGAKKSGAYLNGSTGQLIEATPTVFNLLLTAENDIGSLNSEFYVSYYFNETWGVKAGAQHFFVEYKTASEVQKFPEPNDRFRITRTVFMLGVSYRIKSG